MYAAIATFQNKKIPIHIIQKLQSRQVNVLLCANAEKKQNLNRKLHLREHENKKNDVKKGSVFFFSKNSNK